MVSLIPAPGKIAEPKHRNLYRIRARNFHLGVYDEKRKGFIGIRLKFHDRFLDVEYHNHTAFCEEHICEVPADIDLDDDKALFVWLDEQGE
jgi:hypothetical protein